MNKENLNNGNRGALNMPSGRKYTNFESQQTGWKPSIKTGYQEPAKIDISIKDVRIKKQPSYNQDPKPCRKKRIQTSENNFSFKDSLYSDILSRKHAKAHVSEVYSKYYRSNLFKEQPPINSSRSERSVLPSYRGNNFKDIIEYGNAGKYRSETLTQKCNNIPLKARSMSYAELHEYDFRKRPEKLYF